MIFLLAKNTSKSIVNPVSHLLYAPPFHYETILLNLLFAWITTLLFSMVKVHSFFKIPTFNCSLYSIWQLFFHNEASGEYLWHPFSHSSHLPFSVGISFWYIFFCHVFCTVFQLSIYIPPPLYLKSEFSESKFTFL